MRVAVYRKMKQMITAVLLVTLLLPNIFTPAVIKANRYSQSGSFEASGSPMLNPNFTSDQWNKWEIVAWGVFLSNFVVPMADSYETAFSTSSTEGSRGSGFNALNFSQAADPGASGILQNFTQFAVDESMKSQKDLYVSYYYLDQAGNIIEPLNPADIGSTAIVASKEDDPTQTDLQPAVVGPANFTSLLPYNLADADTATKSKLVDNNISAWIAGTPFGSSSFDDVFGVNGMIYRPWKLIGLMDTWNWPDLIAIPPSAAAGVLGSGDVNRKTNNVFDLTGEFPKAYASKSSNAHSVKDIAVAKLPIIWVEGADGKYVKVWDMLDPWDYQVLITMLAKELNSDSAFDSGLGTAKVWEVVQENINQAFDGKSSLKLDCFGNIVTLVGGKPLVVIPAAYNKHLTTKPMVNLVNSLFLTGPTSGVSGQTLLDKGKMPVKSGTWWISNDNESEKDNKSNFGPGMPAFGWKGASMPNNAVALYFDSDTLAFKTYTDRLKAPGVSEYYQNAIDFEAVGAGKVKMFPHVAAILGVLDLNLNGNRKYTRTFKTSDTTGATATESDIIVPKLTLTGISKAAGLGQSQSDAISSSRQGEAQGVKSLMTALTFQDGIVGLLPASFNEVETEYVQTMTWLNSKSDVLGEAVVIPVAMQSGSTKGKMQWSGLARDFVSFYGTKYYPANKRLELTRLSVLLCGADGAKKQSGGNDVFQDFTKYLMYDEDKKPSLPLITHAKTANMAPYMDVPALGNGTTLINIGDWIQWIDKTGFIWREPAYIRGDTVATDWFSSSTSHMFKIAFASMTQRWVKAYPTNKVLTSVASYLGMRGDSEFAAAAAPYVYLSYLDMYGIGSADGTSGVNVSTLNKNPTKFNENIFDAKSSTLFTLNPTVNVKTVSDADKARLVTDYTYDLLSPTKGHEYKRQLLSSIIGNLVLDQYTTTVYGGSLEYRSGGIQQVVTRSQTGFLRFPSLEDNVFTRWFYDDYATVALVLLAIGLVVIILLGIFRGRKFTWFIISTVLLVTSIVVIPFVNDIASTTMDGLVTSILKNKTTLWSMSEMIANSNMEADFLSTDLTAEEAEIASDITKSLSIAYTDRSLMLKQDISHKVVSLGNFAAYQQFASTRWMLPSILRQFTADDNSAAYLYIPLMDVIDDAANAYWWYNPEDAMNSGGIAASDLMARYAVGTQEGKTRTEYKADAIRAFYPDYHWTDTSKVYDGTGGMLPSLDIDKATKAKLSYRSISQSSTGSEKYVVPLHDYVYMYMNNAYSTDVTDTQQVPVLPVYKRLDLTETTATNKLYWGDPEKINETDQGGYNTYLSKMSNFRVGTLASLQPNVLGHGALPSAAAIPTPSPSTPPTTPPDTLNYNQANLALLQVAQKYVRDERDTMYGEFAYLWSTETTYPYFYALVKDTMDTMGKYDYQTGIVNNQVGITPVGATEPLENAWQTKDKRLGVMLNALTGSPNISSSSGGTLSNPDLNPYYGTTRSNFMYQSGATGADLYAYNSNAQLPSSASTSEQVLFTGYVRDVLDLESMFYNVIPYMYQMTVVTGGLTGTDENDKGLFGDELISESQYRTYKGLPQSWLYRCNWATKIVEAPAYNKAETIGYYVLQADGSYKKKYAEVTMTYLPDAYHAVAEGGRDMIFSEAQLNLSGLSESDLTTLELKLIKLNKEVAKKWTSLINYINTGGMTAEVMCRQMALDAMTMFNEIVTPSGLGNSAFALLPASVDLRSLSFDTVMRVVLLNTSKDANFFGTDAMESTITEFGLFTGGCLMITAWICVYVVTIMRAFFLAFLFLMGVYGVARGVFASNSSKKATLLGYLANIGILFALSFLYYQVFNVLMMGADSSSYVNSGMRGTSAAPTVAVIIILIASCLYIGFMWKMFRIALGSVISGSHDLGYGAYKDKARAGMNRITRGMRELRASHAYEDMNSSISSARSELGERISGVSSSSSTSTESSSGSNKRRRSTGASSGTGSGSRVVQGNNTGRGTRHKSALDDHESVDSTISRGGSSPTASNPATNLDDYLATPSPKPEGKPDKK